MGGNNIFECLYDSQVVFAFRGEVNNVLAESILSSIEKGLNQQEQNILVRKRLYTILVECVQNILHHSDDSKLSLILLTADERSYTIHAGNIILNKNIQELKEWLDVINILSMQELRSAYRKILVDGSLSQKGTAGLGFIEIARKSKQNIDYVFKWINDDKSIFSFRVNVPKISPL